MIRSRMPARVWRSVRSLAQASIGIRVDVRGARVRVPGPLLIRVSVVAGNLRLHRILDKALKPGGSVVDVGANIGYNTVYAAHLVGPAGRVVAIEPAADNLRVLRENVAANRLANVTVHAVAAGRADEVRDLYLRGDVSAVNSLYPDSMYAEVTGIEQVRVAPLDDLVEFDPDLVKIDVEGAELDVIAGMPRMLRNRAMQLLVEWHPRLQEAAGYPPDALPRALVDQGFELLAASHTRLVPLAPREIDRVAARLHFAGRPVELVARRA
jgi:FkbM family methyltransferase